MGHPDPSEDQITGLILHRHHATIAQNVIWEENDWLLFLQICNRLFLAWFESLRREIFHKTKWIFFKDLFASKISTICPIYAIDNYLWAQTSSTPSKRSRFVCANTIKYRKIRDQWSHSLRIPRIAWLSNVSVKILISFFILFRCRTYPTNIKDILPVRNLVTQTHRPHCTNTHTNMRI